MAERYELATENSHGKSFSFWNIANTELNLTIRCRSTNTKHIANKKKTLRRKVIYSRSGSFEITTVFLPVVTCAAVG